MKTKLLNILFLVFVMLSGVEACYSQTQLYTVIVGETAILSVTGANGTIQWQQSTDSLTWADIPGATTTPYTVITTTSGTGKRFFRAKITDALCQNATPFYSSVIRHKILTSTTQIVVGNWYAGGIVFYTDGTGHGLIAPQTDQSTGVQWGCYGTSIPGATSLTNGAANTTAIVTACSTRPIAASICDTLTLNCYTDWFLPAKDQLNQLYQQRALVGGFIDFFYWSSSECDANGVWIQNFNNYGSQFGNGKSSFCNVRCVRSFSPTANLNYSNAVVTNQPVTVNITTQPIAQNKCLGNSVTFTVATTGTATISYIWKKNGANITSATNSSYTISNLSLADEGIYTCEVTNLCRTITSNSATLKVIDILANAGLDARICNGHNTQLQAIGSTNHVTESGTLNYSWSPALGLTPTNTATTTANPTTTTNYTVQVTDQLGCTETDQVEVLVQNVFQNEKICLVTVDTITWKNKIMWEKTLGMGSEYYIIYKETGLNNYTQIGNILATQPAEYIDLFSVPESHGDKYKISVLDTCANESNMSFYHKTMNLTIAAFGSTMGLNWDDYVDESGTYAPFRYYIYRGLTPTNMVLHDSVSGSFNSYNDVNVFSVYYYIIGVKKPGGCNTTKSSDFVSYSNKKDNSTLLGINSPSYGTITVSPNPFSEQTTIEIPNYQISNTKTQITITDVTGKTVRTITNPFRHAESVSASPQNPQQIATNLSGSRNDAQFVIERGNLKPGVYFVELRTDRVYRGKLVVK